MDYIFWFGPIHVTITSQPCPIAISHVQEVSTFLKAIGKFPFLILRGVFVVDIERNGLTAGAGGAVGIAVVVVVGLVVGLGGNSIGKLLA